MIKERKKNGTSTNERSNFNAIMGGYFDIV